MSSLSYWERRKVQRMFDYMQSAEDTADDIAKLYQKASGYISHELNKIFERYKRKHHLTDAEAHRLLNDLKDKTSLDELKQALRAPGRGQTAEEILAELESPAFQARLERLQQLQNQIDLTMRQIYKQEKVRSTSHYVDLANEAYYKSIFDIQKRAGLDFSFAVVDPKAIDRVINSKWSGANYSDRIWHNTQALSQDLKQELLINLVTGRTDSEVADIIANKYAQGASNARRLVRTESCNLANQMEMQSYEECGIDTYIYVATLDLRTSTVCRDLDGKRFPVAEQQPGKNCPPMHPWCRSTTICDISDEELAQMKRRARNPETGKNEMVPANMTYEEWYDKNVKGRPEAEKKETMLHNRRADQQQYDKYKAIYGKDAPDSFADFQKMKYNDSKKWDALKEGKQDRINQMEFSEMGGLVGKLGDKETRMWYKSHDEKIPGMIDKTLPIEEQAKQACRLRNENRTNARDLMRDQETRRKLDVEQPNKTFEELIGSKMERKGMTYEQAVEDIIKTSRKTNKQVNESLGLE
ncbi:minor capsid protein [Enterocloster citroniae]|uniref:minor capsid protein n=1 Tax=Enterocloster citroniae TaxID=358743 RepID=UPI0034A2615F